MATDLRARALVLLGGLYFSQGLPYGFFMQVVPVVLRQSGASLTEVGLSSLLAFPWLFKFVVAPWVDRRPAGGLGRRRGPLLFLQGALVLTLLAACVVPAAARPPLVLVVVVVCNLLAATQDVAADALAVDLLPAEARGVGNGVQVAAHRTGMVVGGGVLLVLLADLGGPATFFIMALLLAAASLPLLAWSEPPPPPRGTARPTSWSTLLDWWRARDAAAWILLLFLTKVGESAAGCMLKPLLVDEGFGLGEIGLLLGTFGTAAGVGGGVLGGFAVSRWGARRVLIGAGLAQVVTVAGLASLRGGATTASAALAIGAEQLSAGIGAAALFTAMMDASRPASAATDYTLQASVVVAAAGVGSVAGGALAELLGYETFFGVCAASTLVSVGLVAVFRPAAGGFVPRLRSG